jgi:polysaccharide export outer membrane protein
LSDTALVNKIKSLPYEPLKLQANDDVQVTISSTSPEASQFFNLVALTPLPSETAPPISQPQGYMSIYSIESNGNITMPVLGEIPAAGSTIEELKSRISLKLKDYLKDAIVTARITNFKVTVIGEVGKPLVIPVNGQTINVLEAIGAAGDMTVYGTRKNVRVIRKLPDGNTEVAVLNFNKSDVLQSPYFQLKQNDVVYIEPSKNKGVLASNSSVWVPILVGLAYTAAIIITSN